MRRFNLYSLTKDASRAGNMVLQLPELDTMEIKHGYGQVAQSKLLQALTVSHDGLKMDVNDWDFEYGQYLSASVTSATSGKLGLVYLRLAGSDLTELIFVLIVSPTDGR